MSPSYPQTISKTLATYCGLLQNMNQAYDDGLDLMLVGSYVGYNGYIPRGMFDSELHLLFYLKPGVRTVRVFNRLFRLPFPHEYWSYQIYSAGISLGTGVLANWLSLKPEVDHSTQYSILHFLPNHVDYSLCTGEKRNIVPSGKDLWEYVVEHMNRTLSSNYNEDYYSSLLLSPAWRHLLRAIDLNIANEQFVSKPRYFNILGELEANPSAWDDYLVREDRPMDYARSKKILPPNMECAGFSTGNFTSTVTYDPAVVISDTIRFLKESEEGLENGTTESPIFDDIDWGRYHRLQGRFARPDRTSNPYFRREYTETDSYDYDEFF